MGVEFRTPPLAASATWYEGGASTFWNYRIQERPVDYVRALVYSDKEGTLYLDQSDDGGSTSNVLAGVSVSAGVAAVLPWTKLTKGWYRLRYVNGATAQTSFRIVKDTKGLAEGFLTGSNIPDDQPLPVSMVTGLSSEIDSVDMNKMSKGGITLVHNAITATATSDEQDCRGYNAVLVSVNISDAYNWTFKIQGSLASGGTFVDCYEQANTGVMVAMSYQTNVSKIFLFKGIPDFIKIVATEDENGATVSVSIQPLNA
jgi:hypothetical protein